MSDVEKRNLRRYLFTIKNENEWIQKVKKLEEEYIKNNGKSIEKQIKELLSLPEYIRKVKEDEEHNKKLKKGEKMKNMSRTASEYRETEYPNMSKYWDDMRMFNLNKYTYKPNKNDFLSLGCSFKVFQDIYRVCAKENNCPPAY